HEKRSGHNRAIDGARQGNDGQHAKGSADSRIQVERFRFQAICGYVSYLTDYAPRNTCHRPELWRAWEKKKGEPVGSPF
ncbi:MAG TPA: hypothetical protein VHX90_03480, partial [Verrucomicrobiae bacterium]|nr:hypothetical protein [Verrucomicrobiae bacterium]